MENVIVNGFSDLSTDEMRDIDGGVAWAAIGAGVVKGCTVVGGPVIGAVMIIGGAVAIGAGIYVGVKNA